MDGFVEIWRVTVALVVRWTVELTEVDDCERTAGCGRYGRRGTTTRALLPPPPTLITDS